MRLLKEEKAQAPQKTVWAAKDKAEFLADMSHEIRTLMNSVIGFGDLLRKTSLSEQQQEYVDAINESGAMLISIVNDILDLSKIQSEKLTLEEIDFDFESLIINVLKILRQKRAGKPLELIASYPEGLPAVFKGDPIRIHQIFLNLIGYAIKSTNEGDVSVSVTRADDGPRGEGTAADLRISIQDTGSGIPADHRDLLVEEHSKTGPSVAR